MGAEASTAPDAAEGRFRNWRRLRLILFYLAVVLAAVQVLLVRLPPPEGGIVLDTADFETLAAPDQPAAAGGADRVTLPHSVTLGGMGHFWEGAYRFTFDSPPGTSSGTGEPWSILIPSYSGRILVRVNDALLWDSRWSHTGVIPHLTWPDIVVIPSPVLRDGVNRLEIREIAVAGLVSYLGRIHVGPDALLRPVFHRYHFVLVTLPKQLCAWQVAFALCLLMVWALRPAERACLMFSGILLFSATNNLPLVLPEPLLSETAQRMTTLAFSWMMTLVLPFSLSFVGRRVPPVLAWTLLMPVGLTLAFLVLPLETVGRLARYGAIPFTMALILASIAVLLEAAIRRRHDAAHVALGGALLALCCSIHDWLIYYGLTGGDYLFIARFGVPMLLTTTCGVLMWRFAVALNAVDRFNAQLRREVAMAEAALRVSLEREQTHERAITLEAERSRLTRDLHDGLAGQLVSMVALSGRSGTEPGAFGSAARKALADLRMVLASLAEVGDDLGMMLANFRDQIEPQLRALGVSLDWHMNVLPEVAGWTSSSALELFRLLQEATINAARHSGGDQVRIDITPTEDQGVRVVVGDQGRGGAADRPGGYGLATMRRRARAIGARLAIETGPTGTRVILDLPRHGPPCGPARL